MVQKIDKKSQAKVKLKELKNLLEEKPLTTTTPKKKCKSAYLFTFLSLSFALYLILVSYL